MTHRISGIDVMGLEWLRQDFCSIISTFKVLNLLCVFVFPRYFAMSSVDTPDNQYWGKYYQ